MPSASLQLALALGLVVGVRPAASTAETQPPRGRGIFGGGCFWSVQAIFDKVPGVVSTTAGYAGGAVAHPTYEQVAAGGTGHAEVVQVVFDPAKVSYDRLLEVFWKNIDPLDAGGQFCDRGSQYRSVILYEGEEQQQAALASRERLRRESGLSGPIATEVAPLRAFYRAEEEHQQFYARQPRRYFLYRAGCGRDERLRQIWRKADR